MYITLYFVILPWNYIIKQQLLDTTASVFLVKWIGSKFDIFVF